MQAIIYILRMQEQLQAEVKELLHVLKNLNLCTSAEVETKWKGSYKLLHNSLL
jgi:hypothetical protein